MQEADNLVNQANNKLAKKITDIFTSKEQKYRDACDLFEKAANKYKGNKQFKEAGDTYYRIYECNSQLKYDNYETNKALVEAGNCYKKAKSINDAIRCYEQVSVLFAESGNFNSAGKYKNEVAEIYESEGDLINAEDSYKKAINYFESGDGNDSPINICKKKMASFVSYDVAANLYEELATTSINNSMLKYSVYNYLLKAGLCRISMDDLIGADKAIDNYINIDVTFDGTKEYKLLKSIIKTLSNNDTETFSEIISEYDSTSKLDNWMVSILLIIKKKIETIDESGVL